LFRWYTKKVARIRSDSPHEPLQKKKRKVR